MEVAKIRIGQIDLRDLSSSELASANSVNLVQDNVAALDNNVWVNSNDYATYDTLTANIYNTFAYLNANAGGSVSNDWVNSNDYATYTVLSGLIDTVQDNVAALSGTTDLISDQFVVSTTNSFTLSSSVSDANNILVSLDGILQNPNDDYVVSGTTLIFNNTAPLYSEIELEVRHLSGGSSGGGGGGITTGKAIAMALVFG